MSRFSRSLARDLEQIADRASPSPTAWEEIRQRIDAQRNETELESEMEIIMLSPERTHRPGHRRTWLVAAAAALVVIAVAAIAIVPQGDDRDEPPATQPAPPPTAPPTVPAPEFEAIVWDSAEDPARVNATENRPEHVDGPLTARVNQIVITPGPDDSAVCANAVEEGRTGPGGEEREVPEVDSCLIIDYEYEISDEAVGNGGMDVRDALDTDGEVVDWLVRDLGFVAAGSSESGSAVFPNLGPGATVGIGYEVNLPDGAILFNRWQVEVPDAFEPIDWFDDAS